MEFTESAIESAEEIEVSEGVGEYEYTLASSLQEAIKCIRQAVDEIEKAEAHVESDEEDKEDGCALDSQEALDDIVRRIIALKKLPQQGGANGE